MTTAPSKGLPKAVSVLTLIAAAVAPLAAYSEALPSSVATAALVIAVLAGAIARGLTANPNAARWPAAAGVALMAATELLAISDRLPDGWHLPLLMVSAVLTSVWSALGGPDTDGDGVPDLVDTDTSSTPDQP